jgi:2,3,4,5-tetrahydropyridine-2-carboxylate N-succinyltransferase
MSEFDRDPRRAVIEAAFIDRSLLATAADAVRSVLTDLDAGRLRVARPPAEPDGEWHVEGWVQQAVVLAFGLFEVRAIEGGDLIWQDKLPPKRLTLDDRVRAVPPGVARFGSHLEPGVVLMPGFVNIGAYVGSGTMIDTWATVGSCAQIGRDVHLAGGVGIGGVLEPPGARPVIIEDGAFLGSRCIVVEGVRVGREAVLGANVVLTASTPIVDVTGPTERILKGYVPPRSVVIPGTRPKVFPAGTWQVPCALIVGQRSESTDRKTSLNAALRGFDVQV